MKTKSLFIGREKYKNSFPSLFQWRRRLRVGRVNSLKGVQYAGEASGVNVKTLSGEITILENHRPIITALKKGLLKIYKQGNMVEEISIHSGFLELNDNKLQILID